MDDYTSLDDLADASEMIITGIAGTSTVEELHGIPFTVTKMDNARDLSTGAKVDNMQIRQSGAAGEAVFPDLPPLLTRGESYLLYVEPFTLNGETLDQWVIVGPGQFVMADDTTNTIHRDLAFDDGVSTIPEVVDYDDIAESSHLLSEHDS